MLWIIGENSLKVSCGIWKNPELIAFLIKHGANPNLPDKNKIYPLDSAIKEGFPEIVKILEPITQKEKNSKQVPIEDEDLNWDFEETADEKNLHCLKIFRMP
ncbi:MAG: ankyrin repeat domain-containing protein [Parachlamydiaceae bacterium]|nr:MAG: ankyrin repeat domain-containing protein [Parachlamydiaceae bacterium]